MPLPVPAPVAAEAPAALLLLPLMLFWMLLELNNASSASLSLLVPCTASAGSSALPPLLLLSYFALCVPLRRAKNAPDGATSGATERQDDKLCLPGRCEGGDNAVLPALTKGVGDSSCSWLMDRATSLCASNGDAITGCVEHARALRAQGSRRGQFCGAWRLCEGSLPMSR